MKPRRGPGRPKILVRCPFCRVKYGVAEFRAHLPRCPLRPAKLAKETVWATVVDG